jgi:biotin operon repressor
MTAFQIPEQQALAEHEFQDRRRFVVLPYRAINDRRLRPAALRVLMQAAAYANRAGYLWASQQRIGQDLGVSAPAINRQMTKLKALGYVERIKGGRKGKAGDTLRIVYASELSAADAASIAGELAGHLQERRDMSKGKRRKSNISQVNQANQDTYEDKLVDSTINQQSAIDALAEQYRAEGLPVPSAERLLAEIQGAR